MATHPETPHAIEPVKRYVRYGASPRAGQACLLASKIRAILQWPLPCRERGHPRHRPPRAPPPSSCSSFEAQADGISADDLLGAGLRRGKEKLGGLIVVTEVDTLFDAAFLSRLESAELPRSQNPARKPARRAPQHAARRERGIRGVSPVREWRRFPLHRLECLRPLAPARHEAFRRGGGSARASAPRLLGVDAVGLAGQVRLRARRSSPASPTSLSRISTAHPFPRSAAPRPSSGRRDAASTASCKSSATSPPARPPRGPSDSRRRHATGLSPARAGASSFGSAISGEAIPTTPSSRSTASATRATRWPSFRSAIPPKPRPALRANTSSRTARTGEIRRVIISPQMARAYREKFTRYEDAAASLRKAPSAPAPLRGHPPVSGDLLQRALVTGGFVR